MMFATALAVIQAEIARHNAQEAVARHYAQQARDAATRVKKAKDAAKTITLKLDSKGVYR